MSGQLHALAALPPRKEPLIPIGLEVGWTPEPVEADVKYNTLCGPKNYTAHCRLRSAVLQGRYVFQVVCEYSD
jgi:hypothetical protein